MDKNIFLGYFSDWMKSHQWGDSCCLPVVRPGAAESIGRYESAKKLMGKEFWLNTPDSA
jgi:hypothetical protein